MNQLANTRLNTLDAINHLTERCEFTREDEDDTITYNIKLQNDILFSITVDNQTGEIFSTSLRKTLPDNLTMCYGFQTGFSADNCKYTCEEVGPHGNFLEFSFNTKYYSLDDVRHFKNLIEIPYFPKYDDGTRKYTAEYDHMHLLCFDLTEYIDNEVILGWFSHNSFVKTNYDMSLE